MRVDLVRTVPVSRSPRARQLEAIFDVPGATESRVEWRGEVPIEAEPWSVGLIVGPSGSGKSSLARELFGDAVDVPLAWGGASVIDDFAGTASMQAITAACQAVGFNTIPAWLRPFGVLSTGERFRVELARRLIELPDPIVVDEFTSVVDRQVAQIGSHAVQKYVRRNGRRFVAAACHYDIIDWLQPDWVLEPATMTFSRRSVQRRPALPGTIARVPHAAWKLFAPYHYMSADLHRGARCFGLFVGDRMAAFAGVLHRPHPRVHDVMGVSRLVTLPDWQGLGLAFRLVDTLGAAYRVRGKRLHVYPAHPPLIRNFDRSAVWRLVKRPGTISRRSGGIAGFGGRPSAVFAYFGAGDQGAATALLPDA